MVRLIGDQTEHLKMWAEAERAANDGAKAIESATDKMSTSTVAAGVLVANTVTMIGRKLEALGKSAVASFSEQEDADVALRSALESNGRAVESTFKDYQEFASEIQRTTRYADEAVESLVTAAETFDLTGAAAKKAAKDAIGLAALPGARGSAASMIRISAQVAKGNIEAAMAMARLVPQLRGAKTESEFLAKYQKAVTDGFKAEEAAAGTLSGALDQMGNAVSDLMEDFGAVIAGGLKPMVKWMKEASVLLKGMPAEWKRWTVIILAAVPALVALGVAMKVVGFGAGFLAAGFSLLVNPITLTIAAVVALGYWVLFHTKAGAAAVEWFGKQWAKLKTHIQPAIDDVVAAIKAGKIEAAFEIMWLHIERTWLEGQERLRTSHGGFVDSVIKRVAQAGLAMNAALSLFGALGTGPKVLADFKDSLDQLDKMGASKETAAKLKKIEERLSALNEEVKKAADGMDAAAEAKKALDDALKPTNFGTFGSAETFSAMKPMMAATVKPPVAAASTSIADALSKTPADAAAKSIRDAMSGAKAGEVIPVGDPRIDELLRKELDAWMSKDRRQKDGVVGVKVPQPDVVDKATKDADSAVRELKSSRDWAREQQAIMDRAREADRTRGKAFEKKAAQPEAKNADIDKGDKSTKQQTDELKKELAQQTQELRTLIQVVRDQAPIFVGSIS